MFIILLSLNNTFKSSTEVFRYSVYVGHALLKPQLEKLSGKEKKKQRRKKSALTIHNSRSIT